ncbi:MAG: hypothetical protein D6718_13540, partial [Acidobacteria bacterium]
MKRLVWAAAAVAGVAASLGISSPPHTLSLDAIPPTGAAVRAAGSLPSPDPATEGGVTESAAFLETVPAEESILSGSLGSVGRIDSSATVMGDGSGTLCVMNWEGFRLRALLSADGGASFHDEVTVTDPGEWPWG